MNNIGFENIHSRLVSISEPEFINILDKQENVYLKPIITRLMFKSHNQLSLKCENFNDWKNKVIFFQYLENFVDYLNTLK